MGLWRIFLLPGLLLRRFVSHCFRQVHVLAVTTFALGVPETGFIRLFLPHKKRWLYMKVLASPFLVKFTLLLEAVDPHCLLVLTLDCNVKKIVEQDLRTKQIVNFTSFFLHHGLSAVNGQCFEVECTRKKNSLNCS